MSMSFQLAIAVLHHFDAYLVKIDYYRQCHDMKQDYEVDVIIKMSKKKVKT